MTTQPTIKKQVEDALFNYTIKEVRHSYNSLTLVLNSGREIEISADYDRINETSELSIELFVIKRERVGGYEV